MLAAATAYFAAGLIDAVVLVAAGKRIDVLAKTPVAHHRLAGHEQCRGGQRGSTPVSSNGEGVLRGCKRMERVELTAMRFVEPARKQRPGVGR